MKIDLQCFGAFRPFGEVLSIELPDNATVANIRPVLTGMLEEQTGRSDIKALIASSRFATETDVLPESSKLENGASIAIIPPVAGG